MHLLQIGWKTSRSWPWRSTEIMRQLMRRPARPFFLELWFRWTGWLILIRLLPHFFSFVPSRDRKEKGPWYERSWFSFFPATWPGEESKNAITVRLFFNLPWWWLPLERILMAPPCRLICSLISEPTYGWCIRIIPRATNHSTIRSSSLCCRLKPVEYFLNPSWFKKWLAHGRCFSSLDTANMPASRNSLLPFPHGWGKGKRITNGLTWRLTQAPPLKRKERCSGSYRQAVGFLVIKDDSISERLI